MIYKIISERFPIEFEKAVNAALEEGYELLGAPFGWRDSLHQAVIRHEKSRISPTKEKGNCLPA